MKWRHVTGSVAAAMSLGTAHAQSTVTVYGLMDAGVTWVSNQGGHSNAILDQGIYYPNILGFRGVEDLGGGARAVFKLENQFNLANGQTVGDPNALFGRAAYVGFAKDGIGQLTFGNQYDFMWEELLKADASMTFGGYYNFRSGPYSGLGIPNNPTGASDFDRVAGSARVPSSVKFVSDSMGGFTFGAMYGFGAVAGSFGKNRSVSVGANYQAGPLYLGAAYTDVKYAQINNGDDGIRNWGVGGRYALGQALLNVLFTETWNTFNGARVYAGQVGALYNFTPFLSFGADYQLEKGNATLDRILTQQVTATLSYRLSKRTNVYLEGAYQHAGNGSAPAVAWINGLYGQNAASSSPNQAIARVGVAHLF
ncbi:outer membrane porin [Caballeronia hypogeia]|uniref:Outer membrane porin n=1 Tax=Caballeronia hypogeia TaxID=1777140 RepID=A0A158CVR0_9BURK|nr:porin [Caballeronia hypogeia]SAK86463.1 outer membrane porin [Caballeronia hypogeia]